MREILCADITKAVSELCIQACCIQTKDVRDAIEKSLKSEASVVGRSILDTLVENANISRSKMSPLCQDTGMVVVFLEIGQDVHISGGYIEDAINEGIRDGYTNGYLRKSIVSEPLFERKNTNDNTPAVIHTRITKGDGFRITLSPKGFGSENKSILKMLTPADGIEGLKEVFINAIELAGPNSCPPLVVGVGIGGTMEKAALLSKFASIRGIGSKNPDVRYATLEDELLELANKTGIGPQGLGGSTTAFSVNVEYYPTHIASIPVAINISCHSTRHACIDL